MRFDLDGDGEVTWQEFETVAHEWGSDRSMRSELDQFRVASGARNLWDAWTASGDAVVVCVRARVRRGSAARC